MSSPNGYDAGWQDCEEEYLVPLQSRLQEIINGNDHRINKDILYALREALKKSDHRNQWGPYVAK